MNDTETVEGRWRRQSPGKVAGWSNVGIITVQRSKINIARGEVDVGVPVISEEHAVNDKGSERNQLCKQSSGVFEELLSGDCVDNEMRCCDLSL